MSAQETKIKEALLKWRRTEKQAIADKSDGQKQRIHVKAKMDLRAVADKLERENK